MKSAKEYRAFEKRFERHVKPEQRAWDDNPRKQTVC